MHTDQQFGLTAKGHAYVDAALSPFGGCAPWVSLDAQRAWGARANPVRRSAVSLSPAA